MIDMLSNDIVSFEQLGPGDIFVLLHILYISLYLQQIQESEVGNSHIISVDFILVII